MTKQSFERMSWGYSWVFPAFVSSWKRLIEKYGFKRGLELWNRLLCSPFVVTRQVRLTGFLPQWKHTSEKSLLWGLCSAFPLSSIDSIAAICIMAPTFQGLGMILVIISAIRRIKSLLETIASFAFASLDLVSLS